MTVSEYLLTSLRKQLDAMFPHCEVYTGKIRSGVKLPCFFVSNFDARVQDLMDGKRWLYTNSYSISYLSESEEADEVQVVKERLLFGLEDFASEDGYFLRADNVNIFIDPMDNNDLTYTGDFTLEVYRERDPIELMDRLEQEITLPDAETPGESTPGKEDIIDTGTTPEGDVVDEVGLMETLKKGWRIR